MRNAVLAVVLGVVLTCGIANATIPEEAYCSVTPCDQTGIVLTCPDYLGGTLQPVAGVSFTVNVRNGDNNVIPNAYTEVVFDFPGNHEFCSDIVATGTTDDNGNITFNLSAGGCTMTPSAIHINANTYLIRTYDNVKSPDWDGTADGQVALSDFIVFANAYAAGAGGCTDYFGDGVTNLNDFILFGSAWAHYCP